MNSTDFSDHLAVTVGHVYSNKADTLQYKTIFDQLQYTTHSITGRSLKLKRLSRDGTLVSIGVDLELAQVLGAGESFLPSNDVAFSGIHATTDEELAKYFIRGCYTHVKRSVHLLLMPSNFDEPTIYSRGVHSLKPSVTDKQYEKIINFPYLESKEEVNKFSDWIKSLGIPKVQGTLSFFRCSRNARRLLIFMYHSQPGGTTRSKTLGSFHP